MPFTVGISAGLFSIAKERGPQEAIQFAGLPRKAMYAVTKGVSFIQLDLESLSEFRDPFLEDGMANVRRLGLTYGMHSETPAFGSREFPHLDSAIDIDYRRGHERMIEILNESAKIQAKYVLIHSSESTPFLFLSRELQPVNIVDPWGRDFEIFLNEQKLANDEKIMDWVWKQDYIWIEIIGDSPAGLIERAQKQRVLELNQTRKLQGAPILTKEEEEEAKKQVAENEESYLKEYFRRHTKSGELRYGPERTAYYIIGKWMESQKDPLWKNIIDVTVEYFARREGKTKEEWLKEKEIDRYSIDNIKFRDDTRLWVPAVSAKYVWGHFSQKKCPDGKSPYPDPKKILEEDKIFFVFETPMAGAGMEELLRFPQPGQMYYLVKEIGLEWFGIAVDLEHLLMDGINPDTAIDVMPEESGAAVRVIHTGWPSPLGPAHIPIPIGSEQHMYLYEMYYKMRQKGMGKENEVYLIFERGGGEDPVQQSILALRLIVKNLEKDIPPDKLPKEFFGMETGQPMSLDRQRVTIHEHAYEPLKGTLLVPEEGFGFLSSSAIAKGKRPEEWKKEELR